MPLTSFIFPLPHVASSHHLTSAIEAVSSISGQWVHEAMAAPRQRLSRALLEMGRRDLAERVVQGVQSGKGTNRDMGKATIRDMGKETTRDMGKGTIRDMGKGTIRDMGKGTTSSTCLVCKSH